MPMLAVGPGRIVELLEQAHARHELEGYGFQA